MMKDLKEYLDYLLDLSKQNGDQPFVAILVDGNRNIVSEGVNQFGKNPIFHSETHALTNYFQKSNLENPSLENYTLISTAEPCPMCMAGIVWSNVGKTVFGTSRKTLVSLGLDLFNLSAHDIKKDASSYKGKLEGPMFEEVCDPLFVNWQKIA